ncbi:MAG TPA: methyltransferase [Clostridia bacterium]|nr:methyltransferase [Clostridia bacterium]
MSAPDQEWDAERLLELGRSYQAAAVLAAAAELEIFAALRAAAKTAADLAESLQCDARGLTILLDALAALGLITKSGDRYSAPPDIARLLSPDDPQSVLAMAQHQANCLRNWAQAATAVKTGRPPARIPSVRGSQNDLESFIGAMHNVSAPCADSVIRSIQRLQFRCLLDVGAGPGTWSLAFLRACPEGRAVLFDLPEVIPLARRRFAAEGLSGRAEFVAGDYNRDAMPPGADLAWVSAIVHQNSREQNRALFKRIYNALQPGGRIAIRDIVMEPDRTQPVAGALFAVNMLVGTELGGTFTYAELCEDLASAGFVQPAIDRREPAMNTVIVASR